MSLKRNTIANYIGQGLSLLLVIAVTPLYLKYLGAEAYGLIGFFTLMQSWMNLLDLGMSTTIGRKASCSKCNIEDLIAFKTIVRSLEILFLLLGIVAVGIIFVGSDWIAQKWISSTQLESSSISTCISIMGVICGLRWFSTVYRSCINGLENQVLLNVLSITTSILKYPGALLLLIDSPNIISFFIYQLVISIIETCLLGICLYHKLPSTTTFLNLKPNFQKLRELIPFSTSIAFTTTIWTIITRMDSLILSKYISLEHFGYYSLIILIAGSLVAVATPLFLAFVPRLTILREQNQINEMIILYRNLTQLVTWLVSSASFTIIFFSKEILFLCTSNTNASNWGSEILIWSVLGYTFFILGSFQYYLQNVFGNIKQYVYSSSIALAIHLPLLYFVTTQTGAIGAARLWFIFNISWFFIITYLVYKKMLPHFYSKWLFFDIFPIFIISALCGFLAKTFANSGNMQSQTVLFLKLLTLTAAIIIISGCFIPVVRLKALQIKQSLLKTLMNRS